MRKIYNKIIYILEEVIPSLALITIVFSLIIQVFFRYFLRISLSWTQELSLWSYVWLLYLGAAHARRKHKHVKLDIVYEKLPVNIQKSLDILFNLLVIIIYLRLIWPVWDYLWWSRRILTPTLDLSRTLVFFVFPLFMVLIIIHNTGFIIKDLKQLFLIDSDTGS